MKKKNIGSSFDGWLREEGIYEEVTASAIKRVLARQVEAAMKERNFSKAEMARRMHTSRAALDRLLDPEYDAVTLSALRKAAAAGAGSFDWSCGRRLCFQRAVCPRPKPALLPIEATRARIRRS
jgi:antitoxin HicB